MSQKHSFMARDIVEYRYWAITPRLRYIVSCPVRPDGINVDPLREGPTPTGLSHTM